MTEKRWNANWVWAAPEASSDDNPLVYFRRTFELKQVNGVQLIASLSADSRYRLYVNGQSVTFGPARGDLRTHYYETLDLSRFLVPGRNVIAAKVLHYTEGSPRPSAIVSASTGAWLFEGTVMDEAGNTLACLDTDTSWRCLRDSSITFLPEYDTCVGGPEQTVGSRLPFGWEQSDYDDSKWSPVHVIGPTYQEHIGFLMPWQLEPRTIPLMYEKDRNFARIVRSTLSHEAVVQQPHVDEAWLSLPAGGHVVIELDAGELTTGHICFEVTGGSGGKVEFLCTESYVSPEGIKTVRDQHEGNELRGYVERYEVAGRDNSAAEYYETFSFRTFRFVQVKVSAGNTPLVLHRFYYRETGYPLEVKSSFESSEPRFNPLWEVSIRTLQRCMHEGYYDCPYYEQLQYSMDTRLQILFTYVTSGDDRLARKAIYDFHSSLLPNGLVLARYPSIQPQVIPGFALFWIMMVYDHLMYTGDTEFAARYRPTIDAVLDWFARHMNADDLVVTNNPAYWSYVDWVKEWEDTRGAPHVEEPLTVYNLMYADALKKAAVICEHTGRPDTGAEYRSRAASVVAAVNRHCWDEEKGLYRNTPQHKSFSQHAQIWAILAGAIERADASMLAKRLLTEPNMQQVSYAMTFYLFRALSETDQYAASSSLWQRWYDQLDLHLTTWLEDPVTQRSDCHAWGSVPLYEFTSEILGVKPGSIGFGSYRIEPKIAGLQHAKGAVMTRHGLVHVAWEINDDQFSLQVSGLGKYPAHIKLPDGSLHEVHGEDAIELHCSYPDSVTYQGGVAT